MARIKNHMTRAELYGLYADHEHYVIIWNRPYKLYDIIHLN